MEKYMEQLWHCQRRYGGQTCIPYGDSCDNVSGDIECRHGHHIETVVIL